ncbi:hypothetical protein BASA60_003215 [Batrachochytrium salamandrivorans]|nr:hypothetical protein BASA60_003215 [Batrachochytrium salamandrivorans]
MNDPNNESARSSTTPRLGMDKSTPNVHTASKADAECRKNRSLIRPYILGSASQRALLPSRLTQSLDPMAYPPGSNCSSSLMASTLIVSPAMEQLSTLLVEAGLMLCELACISRASSPVVTTGNPGDHFMTGVACRFVYAIFQIVCHELDSSTCDWMQRLMHAIIPDEDTSESLSSTW